VGAHHHDGLFSERVEDRVGESFRGSGCVLLQTCPHMSTASGLQGSRCRVPREQVGHSWVVEVRAQSPLEGWLNLGEQPAYPVGRRGDLGREVVIEAAEDREFGQRFILQSNRAQRVRHGPGCFGDDGGITSVGFGLARVQVRDPAHCQARQIANRCAGRLGDATRSAPMVAG
jgi:hypothetical protein